MHNRRLLVGIVLILTNLTGISQDIRFSQFYASPLHLNPAFAGAAEKTRFVSNFRSQWSSLPGSFVTTSASLDDYASKYRSGGGVLLTYDQVSPGKLSSTEMALLYYYKINIGDDWELKTGLQASVVTRKLNYYRYTYEDQLDVITGIGNTAESLDDAQAQ
jgi:type IX secretion system PorP/SprF family membrane protein